MNLKFEKLTLLDVAAGLEACGQKETVYMDKLRNYFSEGVWGDIQAYYEVRDWERYGHALQALEQSSRVIGAAKLADALISLGIAAKEKNEYYIESHQAEVMDVYLDLLDQLEEVVLEKQEQEQEEVKGPTARILVVDDDEESLQEAVKILKKKYDVCPVPSSKAALTVWKEFQPELLLIDVYMPETNGFEMLELLQQRKECKDVPVVFLTTDHDPELEVRGFKAGAQDFITKPYRKEIVFQRIDRILELSRLQKDLQKEVEKQTRQAEERRRQVERLTDQIISALSETIDAKDSYTNGHSLRVAQYSLEIAKRAGKKAEEQERIYYMGMLHDIGKIGIPDSIITKNSGLSDKEYFVTRKHPEIGAEILANISEIPDLGIGARWHHERYDGTGYPDGLKGTDIPEEARLIAVADAYDAMASRRSYRDVLPQQVVYEEIKKGKGTQFDPVFADIMLQLMEEDKEYNMREK